MKNMNIYIIGGIHTVSILSVGVWLEGKNWLFDTNRKDRNCIGLIAGVILTLYPNIGLILCILTPHPNRVKIIYCEMEIQESCFDMFRALLLIIN